MTPLNWFFEQIISVSQLSVYGAVADLCGELARDSRGTENPAANEILESMVLPTEFPTAHPISQTDGEVQGNLLREYEQKFAELLEHENWPTSVPMLVFRRTLRKDNSSKHLMMHLTIWEDHVESILYLEVRKIIPRERVYPWKHEDGPNPGCEGVLSSRTFGCGDRDRIFISWQNSFLVSHRERNQQIRDRNVRRNSWSVENRGTEKPVAKAKPRPKPTSTMSLVSFPYRERKWIDVEPGKFSQGCFEVSKFMIRLLRHDDTVHQEDDGAVRFDDLAEVFKSRFAGASHWSIEARISFLAKGGGPKKRFQYCLNPNSSKHFLYLRATQGHSGGTLVDPTLQDNVLSPNDFADYIYHIGNAHDMHSIIQVDWFWEEEVSKVTGSPCFSQPWTRCTPIKIRKKFNTIWIDPESRYSKTLGEFTKIQFFGAIGNLLREKDCSSIKHDPTQSLFSTLLAIRIEKVVYMKTGEDLYCKVFQSPRLPRVVLTPNLHHGRQDLSDPDSRTSADHQSEQSAKYEETRHLRYKETCRSNVDYRI